MSKQFTVVVENALIFDCCANRRYWFIKQGYNAETLAIQDRPWDRFLHCGLGCPKEEKDAGA
jgi:hypothetical protein